MYLSYQTHTTLPEKRYFSPCKIHLFYIYIRSVQVVCVCRVAGKINIFNRVLQKKVIEKIQNHELKSKQS